MRQTETIALCVLFLFCSSSFIQGQDDSISSTHIQNFSMPSTSSPPQSTSSTKPESFSRHAFLTNSSEGDSRAAADLSANDPLSQSYNDTANSTVTPGTTVNTLAPINSTSVPGSTLTDSQEGSNRPAGDNQTSTASNTTLSTTTTPLAKGKPETSTSAPSPHSQTLSASSGPQITSSPLATHTQGRGKSSTVTTNGSSAPTTTTTTTTTQTTEFSSTPVQAKARVDNPSELNVGDDAEYSGTSMDPLLAGLVSVFVVTAAIVALIIFLKFRHRNERPEFRRLQDLPMDDMMEDTPLSMYSY